MYDPNRDVIYRQFHTYIKNSAVGSEDLIHGGPEEDAVDVQDPCLVDRLIKVDDPDNRCEELNRETNKVNNSNTL